MVGAGRTLLVVVSLAALLCRSTAATGAAAADDWQEAQRLVDQRRLLIARSLVSFCDSVDEQSTRRPLLCDALDEALEGELNTADTDGGKSTLEKRKASFIRFGKRKASFIRFGKRKASFIRFGKRKASFIRFG